MILFHISSGGFSALTTGFPDGTGQIWLDDVACRGNESTLASCRHRPFGQHNCVHNEDAGVRCRGQRKCSVKGGGMWIAFLSPNPSLLAYKHFNFPFPSLILMPVPVV